MNQILDWIIVGGGPAGLACAIEAKKRNLDFWLIEKGCLVHSIYRYPVNMKFFTTANLLEIGGVPMIISSEKPKRVDGLKYYRRVADDFELPIKYYERVISVKGQENDFLVQSIDQLDQEQEYRCRRVILATGYYDNPNMLDLPGEDLPKVSHYYSECHPYFQKKVAVIGGQNSAAEAALDLYRNGGAEVTLIHRGEAMEKQVKYWVLPDINNRIKRFPRAHGLTPSAIDDEFIRILGNLGIEIVHQHAHRRLRLPGLASLGRAARGSDGSSAGWSGGGGSHRIDSKVSGSPLG